MALGGKHKYHGNLLQNFNPRIRTLIYCHSTVTPSFCVIKQYYDSNYHGMAVSNTMVIYRGISTLEITGIFITLAGNYQYFYIGPWLIPTYYEKMYKI